MKTVLITCGNMGTVLGLGEFLCRFHEHIVAVFLTTRLPSQRSNVMGVLSMWRSSGFAYTHFKLLTNLLLPRKLRRRGLPTTLTEFLGRLGSSAEIFRTRNINDPEMVERVASFKPEVLLSVAATSRFRDPLLAIPSRIALNTHYGLLPTYAGLSPYFWHLRNQEAECGITLHQITSQLDAGPIIEQRRFSMQGLSTVLAVLSEQLANVSPALVRFYSGESSEREAHAQDLSKRGYFRHPTRRDVAELLRHGHRFYDRADLARIAARLSELASVGAVQHPTRADNR